MLFTLLGFLLVDFSIALSFLCESKIDFFGFLDLGYEDSSDSEVWYSDTQLWRLHFTGSFAILFLWVESLLLRESIQLKRIIYYVVVF